MKFKKLLSILTSAVSIVTMAAVSGITAFAEADYIISDEDKTADADWGQAITVQGDDLDRSIFKEDCVVVVEYDGGGVEFILQSWKDASIEGCDKAIWAKVAPASDENGVAQFTYADMEKAFVEDNDSSWDCLLAYHVGVTTKDTVVHKAYITYGESAPEEPKEEEPEEEPKEEAPKEEPKEEAPKEDETASAPKEEADNSDTAASAPDAPTLSFDMSDWKNYVKLTPDASIAGMSLSTTNSGQYQGATLNVSVKMTSDLTGKYPSFAESIKDDDGNLVYPEAANEDAEYVKIGLEFNAADFGVDNFDNCMVTFKYLFNEDVKDILMNGSIYIYPANDDYEILTSNAMSQRVNTITRENIDTYTNGFVSVAPDVAATKIIIEIPLMKAYTGDVMRIDNFVVSKADGKAIANLDGYNDTAKPMNEFDGKIKITGSKGSSSDSSASSKSESKSGGFNPLIIVIAAVVVAVIVVLVIFFIKKKNSYY